MALRSSICTRISSFKEKGWSIRRWFQRTVIPSALYSIQNRALGAFQNVDAVTFNVLSQTKTLSAAFCCYMLLDTRQSWIQMIALLLFFLSALIIQGLLPVPCFGVDALWTNRTKHSTTKATPKITVSLLQPHHPVATCGIIRIVMASCISGLAGAFTQQTLQQIESRSKLVLLQYGVMFGFDYVPSTQSALLHGWRVDSTTRILEELVPTNLDTNCNRCWRRGGSRTCNKVYRFCEKVLP